MVLTVYKAQQVCIFVISALITTKPDFNVVTCRLGKLLAEPWWVVEATAGTLWAIAMAICIFGAENDIDSLCHRSNFDRQMEE